MCSHTKRDKWRVEEKTSCQIWTVAPNLESMLFRVKLVRPVLADRTDMMFCKEGKKKETGSSIMLLCATMFLSMSAVTTSGLPEITEGRGRVCVHINKTSVRAARIGRDRFPSSIAR